MISQFSLFIFFCFSLVVINRQTSYDSGIIRQDYGIMQGFIGLHQSANLVWLRYLPSGQRNRTRFADESYEVCRLNHLYWNGPKRACLTTASDQVVRANHTYNCNSWFSHFPSLTQQLLQAR